MARKGKVGIDYFSHDVDMLQDKKIKIIKAKHGLIGYAVYLRLLEEVYRETGYYIQLDDDFNILFSDDNNLNYDVYILILNDCIEKGLFNKEMYEKYSILTSDRIQTNYCSATERRKEVEFTKEYLLINVEDIYNLEKVNVNILSLNDNINPQSKGKESKTNKKEIETIIELNISFNEFWNEYDYKKGNKANIEKKWNKLKDQERNDIMEYLPRYKASTPDKQYRKQPQTFLNGRAWEDEILEKKGFTTKQKGFVPTVYTEEEEFSLEGVL